MKFVLKTLLIATAIAITAASSLSLAQADEANRLKLARQFVQTTHEADHMRQLAPKIFQQMRATLIAQRPADVTKIDSFIAAYTQKIDAQAGPLVDLIAQIYAREFSDDDLANLLAFYRSPTGQHLTDKRVVIAQGIMQGAQQWSQLIAKQVISDIAKEKPQQAPKL